MESRTRVFLCYRQVDGKDVARWLYERLQGRVHAMPGSSGAEPHRLDVYFDQATPALGDWQALHRPSLESAHALLVVCTPGLLSKLGHDDWVHREIDWWLEHRKIAPILVDTTNEGSRWIPASILARWPNAQRLLLNLREFDALPEVERSKHAERLIQRIIGGITISDGAVRFEELEQQKALLAKQKRLLGFVLLGLLATVAATGFAAWFSHRSQLEAEKRLAGTLMQQANQAWEMDNGDFARILSAEAVSHDGSHRTRHAAAAIHYWYANERGKALERFEGLLTADYERLVKESVLLQRSQRYARGQGVVSALNTYLTLTATVRQSGYEWVYRLGGIGGRIERSLRNEVRADPASAAMANKLAAASSEVARHYYHRAGESDDVSACEQRRESAAREAAELEQRIMRRVAVRATRPFEEFHASTAMRERLSDGQALVHYWRYRDRYVAWVVTGETAPKRVELGAAVEIDAAVRDFVRDISSLGAQRPARPRQPVPPAKHADRALGVAGITDDSAGVTKSGTDSEKLVRGPILGERVKRLVWDPIKASLPLRTTLVYIVPDAAIGSVPFAALPGEGSQRHLIDHITFAHLATIHDLLSDETETRGSGALLISLEDLRKAATSAASTGAGSQDGSRALKVFTGDSPPTSATQGTLPQRRAEKGTAQCTKPVINRGMFPPLPGTAREVKAISDLLGASGPRWSPRVLTGKRANEATVRREMTGRRVLHFATHAWLDSQQVGGVQGLAKFDDAPVGSVDTYIVNSDPLLATGLLLNGADRAAGMADGYLTGYEVATLDLHDVELVVLSACDTAGSSRGGNGLVGLATAFREAGARSIVASLYPVADDETSDLMVLFYRSLASGGRLRIRKKSYAKPFA